MNAGLAEYLVAVGKQSSWQRTHHDTQSFDYNDIDKSEQVFQH